MADLLEKAMDEIEEYSEPKDDEFKLVSRKNKRNLCTPENIDLYRILSFSGNKRKHDEMEVDVSDNTANNKVPKSVLVPKFKPIDIESYTVCYFFVFSKFSDFIPFFSLEKRY